MEPETLSLLIPIGICVVLPIMLVWIYFRSVNNSTNRRTEVLIKAIENNANIDAEKIAEALGKDSRSAEEMQLQRLLRGCIFTLIGVMSVVISQIVPQVRLQVMFIIAGLSFAIGAGYLIVYFVARRSSAKTEKEE